MPKFFVFSDVHGFYSILMEALSKSGYDKDNPEHWLVSCGDNFDRGKENLEMLNFLQNVNRIILIKGNHEDMLMDMLLRGSPGHHDIHNFTADTVLQITGELENYIVAYNKLLPLYEKMENFFETKKYIFVHGWIPTRSIDKLPPWAKHKSHLYYNEWRKASENEWIEARWLNGMKLSHEKIIEKGKTIVCGHYHTTWGKVRYHNDENFEFGMEADFSPYYDEGIIAIDACTVCSGKVNVIVIEDDFIEE